jgi:hypothetical protein
MTITSQSNTHRYLTRAPAKGAKYLMNNTSQLQALRSSSLLPACITMSNLLLPKQLVCAATAAASGTRLRHKHANGIQYPLMSPRYQFYKQCAMRDMIISTTLNTQHPQRKLSSRALGCQHSTQADMYRLPLALGRRCAAVQASDDKQLEEGTCNGNEVALLHHVQPAAWARDPSIAMRHLPDRPSGHFARACVLDCLPGGCAAQCHMHVSFEPR